MIVESELDAILLHQEAGDLIQIIALGSASARPDQDAVRILLDARMILLALDSDAAGAKESWKWWKENFPRARRWRVIEGKDPTEAYQKGLPLRDWVRAGIELKGTTKSKEVEKEKYVIASVPLDTLQVVSKIDGGSYAPNGVLTEEPNVQPEVHEDELIRLAEDIAESAQYSDGVSRVKCCDCVELDSQYTCRISKQRMSGIALLRECEHFFTKNEPNNERKRHARTSSTTQPIEGCDFYAKGNTPDNSTPYERERMTDPFDNTKTIAELEHEADFGGLQADFFVGQLDVLTGLEQMYQALKRFLLKGDSVAECESNQLLRKEIRASLLDNIKWIFEMRHSGAKMGKAIHVMKTIGIGKET
jgi:hypothetical protein